MAFNSILFPETEADSDIGQSVPYEYFNDLKLNQIIEKIIGKKDYLQSIFRKPLHNKTIIKYRQDIMRELEDETLFNRVKLFTDNIYFSIINIKSIINRLNNQQNYYCNYVEKGKMLDAARIYCEEIADFAKDLSAFGLNSEGLFNLRDYISNYINSEDFRGLLDETMALKAKLSTVKYCMLIKGNCIKVRKYEDERDYNIEIEKAFIKFRQGKVKNYRKRFLEEPYAEHVEAGVLNLVARLYPEIFSELDRYAEKNKAFLDEVISTFTEELQFYITYIEYITKFKKKGFKFCYPEILCESKAIYSFEGFDLALAGNLIDEDLSVICNDFYLDGKERIIVVTGPNQGGKTTFARTFGQMHYLASLGCQVPGKRAALFLCDGIYTHFEKEEDIKTLNGKLQDELTRMHNIFQQATSESIIIINEILTSTSLVDAVNIGKKIMEEIIRLDSLCVYVTFVEELASLSEKNVSMVSTVSMDNPIQRTYKIIRSPADGISYAIHIAQKYGLTYDCLKGRIRL